MHSVICSCSRVLIYAAIEFYFDNYLIIILLRKHANKMIIQKTVQTIILNTDFYTT